MPGARLESAFANLAYARLKDRAPGLLDFLIGFQMIDSNEDETQAVGVFGFRIKDEWYFNPVFYLNGRLKGEELLYIKSQDSFVPLQENWVNYLVSRRPKQLGELEKHPINSLGMREPDLSLFKHPNLKVASMLDAKGVQRLLSALPTAAKFDKLAARVDLPTFLKAAGRPYLECLLRTMEGDEKFAEAVTRYYNIQELADTRFAHTIVPRAKQMSKAAASNGKVTIKMEKDRYDVPVNPSTSSNKAVKVVTRSMTVEDSRVGDETSKAWPTEEFERTVMNPTESGVYTILLRSGGSVETLVIQNPIVFSSYESTSDRSVVFNPKDKRYGNFRTSAIFVIPSKVAEHDTWRKMFVGFKDADSMEVGKVYFLVNKSMSGTTPFRVSKVVTGREGRTVLEISSREWISERNRTTRCYSSLPAGRSVDTIILTSKAGNECTQLGNTLYVPSAFKAVEVNDEFEPGSVLEPGDMCDVQDQLLKSGAVDRIKILNAGTEWFITSDGKEFTEPMSKESAYKSLMLQHGLRADVANRMIQEARTRHASRYLVKYADGYPAFPTYMEPPTGFDSWTGVQTTEPFSTGVNVGMKTDNQDQYRMLPSTFDDPTKKVVSDAAKTGQKEVFDTSVLSGLVKTVDSGNAVDEYLGDMLMGLDRVGRILFIFYWHNDKFRERYGQQDMPELEDQLRNVFKSLGDLTLFLKQKTVEAEPGEEQAEIDLDATTGGQE